MLSKILRFEYLSINVSCKQVFPCLFSPFPYECVGFLKPFLKSCFFDGFNSSGLFLISHVSIRLGVGLVYLLLPLLSLVCMEMLMHIKLRCEFGVHFLFWKRLSVGRNC